MRIDIGNTTKEYMKLLGVKEYPFSDKELSSNFREKIKAWHPDVTKKDNAEEKAREFIDAYKHLKNLAVSFVVEEEQREEMIKRFQEDENLFSLWDICPECSGKGRMKKVNSDTEVRCIECDPVSTPPILGWLFAASLGGRLKFKRSSGVKTLKCPDCHGTGKFKQRKGKTVTCYLCKGTGFKKVKCRKCGGSGVVYGESLSSCWKCKGLGKIELNPFNPVIRKGSVLV